MLQSATARLKVFGSESHGFRTNPPLSEKVVRKFESEHQIQLASRLEWYRFWLDDSLRQLRCETRRLIFCRFPAMIRKEAMPWPSNPSW